MSRTAKQCRVVYLGRVPYREALDLQLELCARKRLGFADDFLLLLEHPPTLTLGRNGTWRNLRAEEAAVLARGIERFEVDRGGDITFHGPGQLVGYPILRLDQGEQDVRRYMRNLEEVVIRALGRHGIAAGRAGGLTGVWTEEGKIAALGVHISRWITRHGFALNVNTDLAYFDLIVPCGIAGCRVAAMQQFTGRPLDLAAVAEVVAAEFGPVLGRETVWFRAEDLLDESDFTAAAERATIIEAARPGADRAAEFAGRPTA